jgi:hypothetical protein
MNVKEYGRKFSGLKLRYCPDICLEGLRKNYENLSSPGKDSNQTPSKYKSSLSASNKMISPHNFSSSPVCNRYCIICCITIIQGKFIILNRSFINVLKFKFVGTTLTNHILIQKKLSSDQIWGNVCNHSVHCYLKMQTLIVRITSL